MPKNTNILCRAEYNEVPRTALRPLYGQNVAGFKSAEICFYLYSIISGESNACDTKVFNLFTLIHPS